MCAGTEASSTKKALLALLRPGGALAEAGAVIAYATFQAQTEQVAQFLTSHGIRAAAYHAGKHAKAWLFHLRALQGTAAADWLGHVLPVSLWRTQRSSALKRPNASCLYWVSSFQMAQQLSPRL